MSENLCSECGGQLSFIDVSEKLSTARYPALLWPDGVDSWRCARCLAVVTSRRVKALIRARGLDKALQLAAPYGGSAELIEGVDYTVESGHWVFSQWFHLKRGSCCHSGCRHCPYP